MAHRTASVCNNWIGSVNESWSSSCTICHNRIFSVEVDVLYTCEDGIKRPTIESASEALVRHAPAQISAEECKHLTTSVLAVSNDANDSLCAQQFGRPVDVGSLWKMRGLPFPSSARYDREPSYEYNSPANNPHDIPIDPALGGPAIDPAIIAEATNPVPIQHISTGFSPPSEYLPESSESLIPQPQASSHYSQGPQGDPFAPLPPPIFLPHKEPVSTLKQTRRKRRPRREGECGFCPGDGVMGENGEPEPLMTCSECGRSGHRSCMQLTELSDRVLEYPWTCSECKNCEICHEKSNDDRILFCDSCDRGWHMDCLTPPIAESPPGKWFCPLCPPLEAVSLLPMEAPESGVVNMSADQTAPLSSIPLLDGGNDDKGEPPAVPESAAGIVDTNTPITGPTHKHKKSKDWAAENLAEVNDSASQSRKKRRHRDESLASPVYVSHPPVKIRLRIPARFKGKERQEEEEKRGLFEEILRPEDRDTSKTTIELSDTQRYNKSRIAAESKLVPLPPPRPSVSVDTPETPGPSTRPLRSAAIAQAVPSTPMPHSGPSASPAPSTPGPQRSATQPQGLRIRTIRFGQYDIDTWYDAPFPEEYATIHDGRLWICEFCLKYMKSRFGAERHRMKCKSRHPPGDEIYRDGKVSVFEVDGRKNKIYCQNLCLLSKMFLDHKSLFYDVEPFLFYVMTEVDEIGARFMGYFSKEKRSPKDYNVSCIMTLPVRQRQGWGNLLIDFSYLLSKKEGRAGSPEKPLSALGVIGYRSYWTLSLMRYLQTATPNVRFEDISAVTSMTTEDIYTTLCHHSMISAREMSPPIPKPSPGQSIKFPKGRRNGIARRHLQRTKTQTSTDGDGKTNKTPFVAPTEYEIHWDQNKVDEYLRNWEAKKYWKLKPEKLKWSPFLLARVKKTEAAQAAQFAEAAPSPTVGNPFGRDDVVSSEAAATEVANCLFGPSGESSALSSLDAMRVQNTDAPTEFVLSAPPKPRSRHRSPNAVSTPRSLRKARSRRSTSMSERIDDMALAAKLDLEERLGHRQLRTRKSTVNAAGPETASVAKSKSPKKRGRVIVSPFDQVEGSAGMLVDGESNSLRDSGSIYASSGDYASADSDLNGVVHANLNGRGDVNTAHRLASALPDAVHSSSLVDGVTDLMNELKEDGVGDLGSPLTGITSRQSVPAEDIPMIDAYLPTNGVMGEAHLKVMDRLREEG